MKQDALPDCLEQATTNLLLDNFGCATNSNVQLQLERRETGIRGSHPGRKTSAIRFESEEERMFAELLLREEEDRRFLDTNMSMEECEYDIDVEVPNIIPLGKSNQLEKALNHLVSLSILLLLSSMDPYHRLYPPSSGGVHFGMWTRSIDRDGHHFAGELSV